jgi:osmotically inducible protein OsmC
MATRNGSARWDGDVRSGSGCVTVGEDLWTGTYSWSRFAGVLDPDDGPNADTNPEELLAAAHAACFSMALSLTLGEEGHAPESIETKARVHLRVVDGIPTIQEIDVATRGRVAGLDEEAFSRCAELAKDGCIISRALGGVETINLTATLAE